MKFKLLLVTALLFCVAYGNATTLCPVYRIGKIYVVDEDNNRIQNAKVWDYRSLTDSFEIKRGGRHNSEKDSTAFYVYDYNFSDRSGYYYRENKNNYKAADKLCRIHAEGYADVILKDFNFKYQRRWRGDTLPVLIITMYSQKYVKLNNSISLLNEFYYNKTFEVNDTVKLAFGDYMGNTDELQAPADAVYSTKVETYPNPVKSDLLVKLNFDINGPVRAKICDTQGKLVDEFIIESATKTLDLGWYRTGNYFLTVYDEKGSPIYSRLIFKM